MFCHNEKEKVEDSSKPENKVEQVIARDKRNLLKNEEEVEKIPFDTLHKEV